MSDKNENDWSLSPRDSDAEGMRSAIIINIVDSHEIA